MDGRADGQTEIRTDEDAPPYSDERTHLYGLICGKLSSPSRDAVDDQFQRTFDVLTDIKLG